MIIIFILKQFKNVLCSLYILENNLGTERLEFQTRVAPFSG